VAAVGTTLALVSSAIADTSGALSAPIGTPVVLAQEEVGTVNTDLADGKIIVTPNGESDRKRGNSAQEVDPLPAGDLCAPNTACTPSPAPSPSLGEEDESDDAQQNLDEWCAKTAAKLAEKAAEGNPGHRYGQKANWAWRCDPEERAAFDSKMELFKAKMAEWKAEVAEWKAAHPDEDMWGDAWDKRDKKDRDKNDEASDDD